MKFTAIALAALLTTCTAVAPANAGGKNGPDFGGNSLAAEIYAGGGYSKSEALSVAAAYADQSQRLSNRNSIGVGVNSTNVNKPTAYGGAGGHGGTAVSLSRGGNSKATGGNADATAAQRQSARSDQDQKQNQTANSNQDQSQTNGTLTSNVGVGGQMSETNVGGQTTDVKVAFAGDVQAASSAIAPTVIHGNNNECYWTFTFAAAAQGMSQGGSAGAGLFPIRLETCMKFMLADRYASGSANHPEAARLLREIEESLK